MRAVRSKDSKAEVALRRALHRQGWRFRLHAADLPSKPDIVFRSRRVAVFVDGDFWHGRDMAKLNRAVRRNRGYWLPKIKRTIERDRDADARLTKQGWRVIRLWETDVLRDPASAAALVAQALREERD